MKRKIVELLSLEIILLVLIGISAYIFLKAPETFQEFPIIIGATILIIVLKIVSVKVNFKELLKKAVSLFL